MKIHSIFSTGLLAIAAFTLVSTSSCRKFETQPADFFGYEDVFDTTDQRGELAEYFLNDIYNYIPNGFNRINGDFLDAATDDGMPSRNNTIIDWYTNGQVSLITNPDPYWANSYFGIRKCNQFLANISRVALPPTYATTYASTLLTRRFWRAEARFMRALFYWELVKRYGGVPLIGDKVFLKDDNIEVPRNSFDSCINYIVSECNAVKDSLRSEVGATAINDAQWGKIPRGAAIALKSRVLLYAASPLMNGGGIETDAAKKALTGYATYDAIRWQRAADAAKELMDLNYYTLISSTTPTIAFASVFYNKRNTEVILAKQVVNSTNLETSQAPVGFTTAGTVNQGLTSPSQNLVDAFPMANGLAITETGSGYSAAAPYTGRDPRLAATVFYNGLAWLGRVVQTAEGNIDKPNTAQVPVQTRTGYYLRKFLGNFPTGTAYANQSHNFIHFRYAEILLNYAETLNELGQVENAVNEVKKIRTRAGIAVGTGSRYGIKAGINQAEMRTLIQNERRIELAFEEHRFWDVRRWKLASQVLNTTINGVVVTGTSPTFTYQVQAVKNIIFNNRLYHMPIPYDEITRNRNLIQNEGW